MLQGGRVFGQVEWRRKAWKSQALILAWLGPEVSNFLIHVMGLFPHLGKTSQLRCCKVTSSYNWFQIHRLGDPIDDHDRPPISRNRAKICRGLFHGPWSSCGRRRWQWKLRHHVWSIGVCPQGMGTRGGMGSLGSSSS